MAQEIKESFEIFDKKEENITEKVIAKVKEMLKEKLKDDIKGRLEVVLIDRGDYFLLLCEEYPLSLMVHRDYVYFDDYSVIESFDFYTTDTFLLYSISDFKWTFGLKELGKFDDLIDDEGNVTMRGMEEILKKYYENNIEKFVQKEISYIEENFPILDDWIEKRKRMRLKWVIEE
jgi:hypothetical protein